jgi:hypothetical protein
MVDERLVQTRYVFSDFIADGRPLPEANQHAVVDYWRPVWQALAICLPCACLVLGLCLA